MPCDDSGSTAIAASPTANQLGPAARSSLELLSGMTTTSAAAVKRFVRVRVSGASLSSRW
jgi:hypothetical protein